MTEIDWNEFKFFKQYSNKKDDNFEVLLDFLKSYYKMTSITEIYETIANDETAQLMLAKRDIDSAEALEKHIFRDYNAARPK
ncbi:MAG: hypothetical protein A2513_02080 [Sulfurimonas sp. RIFOXYD12_FULL_33_39]|uniref:hypothetical protein n=1 Tax=unclassified Sulfurimonas TaxID=2623549 RepID=UPI0008B0E00A|nr:MULTISPECIES: hypothetical protein [unclassified Sulfurimonas]OHE04761.1 MAG: hypothetical protein A3G74_01705 [Sulfurimonas sp. RIFCSPLOWO2_12_FULL_34_6]OHE08783.1 MAG: hypothetical protein A2513_02080 [Sulfurimonas sp. RIFOXYD12_FULL_33_39]OHE14068.1 MAG: hypothetical protein A2530_03405 [Sulfurimonas sp. RIFOXYD2_FULL_34_21]DAB27525.1 MAG TPA: hypothetical protein CFH78_07300 [Sulfurimonas sp. UBA10385]